jgi:hypothetical protein
MGRYQAPEPPFETDSKKIDTPADLAERRKMLAAQIADIEKSLESGKESELKRLESEVVAFNTIFGTVFILTENQPEQPKARKCSVCQQTGHTKKNCSDKKKADA